MLSKQQCNEAKVWQDLGQSRSSDELGTDRQKQDGPSCSEFLAQRLSRSHSPGLCSVPLVPMAAEGIEQFPTHHQRPLKKRITECKS